MCILPFGVPNEDPIVWCGLRAVLMLCFRNILAILTAVSRTHLLSDRLLVIRVGIMVSLSVLFLMIALVVNVSVYPFEQRQFQVLLSLVPCLSR